jgi:hypothetical protein
MYLLHHPYHSMDPWFQHSYFKLMGDTQGETSSHQNNPMASLWFVDNELS